ncbi:hypothetical protein GLOIN_2v865196 [Rhizophagus clarus]|uniref:Ion transport domain-containing protein n=1 Tax=Rhizophagus clarus TaxID=94130 RepID=A0A8H3LG00_9GLOM|nr:hypothetical protein GLOIN_2v865196 [Rhizophagus clarus]
MDEEIINFDISVSEGSVEGIFKPFEKKSPEWIISISPDGENVLKFNHRKLEFEIIPAKNLNDDFKEFEYNDLQEKNPISYKIGLQENDPIISYKVKDEFKVSEDNFSRWMIAISNSTQDTKRKEVLVAISHVTKSDMLSSPNVNYGNKSKNHVIEIYQTEFQAKVESLDKNGIDKKSIDEKSIDEKSIDEESIDEESDTTDDIDEIIKEDAFVERNKVDKTVIYRINLDQDSKFEQPNPVCDNLPGGIVIFVHNKNNDDHDVYCFIFNASGICREMFAHDLDHKITEHFYYPISLQKDLYTLYKKESCIAKLYNSVLDHYFFIEQYKEGIQVLQLYDLRTMKMEKFFVLSESESLNAFGNSIFAKSSNEIFIAFSTGLGKLSLFLIENGLEIASQDFGIDFKILFCEFINDDNTLIIIVQRKESKIGEILYWNLFSTKNHLKTVGETGFLKDVNNISSIARIPGKLFTINNNEEIFSVLDNLINDCNPEEKDKKIMIIYNSQNKVEEPYFKDETKNNDEKHTIFRRKDSKNLLVNIDSKNENKNNDEEHTIFRRKDSNENVTYLLVNNKEPWAINNYNRVSVYLDENESTQLFIGRSTIQVWSKNTKNNEIELEYIWTNNVKADKEKDFPLEINELYVGDRSFYAKIRWGELKKDKFFEVKWPYNDNHVTPIKHACDSLEHLNNRRKKLVGREKQREFDNMKDHISYIIWRFIKNKPDIWRLMDARFDIMAKIIIGGSHTLVKYILFGDGTRNLDLHIPRLKRWDNKDEKKFKKKVIEEKRNNLDIKNLSDLQIAIRFCKGGSEFNRRSLIVAYLLEYYTEISHSFQHVGWLCTVSEALPDLYHYNLRNHAKEIFYKRCISDIKISDMVEYSEITPREVDVAVKLSQGIVAFNPNTKLIPKKETRKSISYYLRKLYVKIFLNTESSSPTVKIFPLQKFTVNEIRDKQKNRNFLSKVFQYIFIPRGYLSENTEASKTSPLIQLIRNESDEVIFRNPAMDAAINYKWTPAKNYFLRIFFTYVLYASCFAALAGCYLGHVEATDLASVVIPLVLVSVYVTPKFKLSNAFAGVVSTSNITAGFSFTMLILWIEFILYLRLFSGPANFIYIMLNIIKGTYLFVIFMLLVVLALSHVFLLLLQHTNFPDLNDITPKTTSYTLQNNAGDTIGTSQQSFDRIQDNPSKDFGTSFLSTYAWLRGTYTQEAAWNFWGVEALTLIGSLFLTTIAQNMFVAFLTSAYDEGRKNGRVELLRYRAELISDYETLDVIHFSPPPSEPDYIYILDNSENSNDEWEKLVKKHEKKNLSDYLENHGLEKKMDNKELSFEEKYNDNSLLHYDEPYNNSSNRNLYK